MHAFSFVVAGVIPYAAAIAFVAGMARRLAGLRPMPRPPTMTLFPAPSRPLWPAVAAEALLWPGLFRGDRLLWITSWTFHSILAVVLVGHIRAFSDFADSLPPALGLTSAGVETTSALMGGVAGVLLLITTTTLLGRRIALQRMREISGPGDYFSLFLLLCVIVTGCMMRLDSSIDLGSSRAWARSLPGLSPAIPEHPLFISHLLCAELLIAYVPFSKMMHFGGIFFSHAALRRS